MNMIRKRKNTLTRILVVSMIISLLTTSFWIAPVLADSSRVAIVENIVGEVFIKKSGGSRELQAYDSMALNQGDTIRTANNSSVELRVEDRDDRITISENTEIALSKLTEKDGGKQSKFKMWAGSIFSKAKSLFSSSDEFEIDTPNATMGVRGTDFYVGVDPETGDTSVHTFSGIVAGKERNKGQKQNRSNESEDQAEEFIIYPSQELRLYNDLDEEDGEDAPPPILIELDIDRFIEQAGPDVIKKLLESKEEIDQENEEMKEVVEQGLKDQGFLAKDVDGISDEDMKRFRDNLDNLIGNVIKKAIESKKIDKDEVDQIIKEINEKNPDNPFNLENVKPIVLSEEAKQRQAKLKQLEQKRKEKQEEKKKQQEELKKQNEALLKKLEEQKKKQQEENKKKQEEAKKKAEEKLKSKLSEEQKERFEEAQRRKEEERQRALDKQEKRKELKEKRNRPSETEEPDDEEDVDSSPSPTIDMIDDLPTVNVNLDDEEYTLPTTVTAQFSDGTTRSVSVTWTETADTSVTGSTTYYGEVNGYTSDVQITVRVLATFGSPIELNGSTGTLHFEQVSLDFSEAELPEGLTLTVTESEAASQDAENTGLTAAGQILNFEFSEEIGDQPVDVKFKLTDIPNPEATIGIFYQSEEGVWLYQPTVVDAEEGVATTNVTHFSTYGVFVADKAAAPTVVPTPSEIVNNSLNISYNVELPDAWHDYSAGFYQMNNDGEWIPFPISQEVQITIPAEGLHLKVKGLQPNQIESDVMEYQYRLPYASLNVENGSMVGNVEYEEYLMDESGLEVSVKLNNISDIYGLELHLEYDESIEVGGNVITSDGIFGGSNAEPPIERVHEEVMYSYDGEVAYPTHTELLYVVLNDENLSHTIDIGEDGSVILTLVFNPVNSEWLGNGIINISEAFVLDAENNRTNLFAGDPIHFTTSTEFILE